MTRKTTKIDSIKPGSILVISLSGIGDALMFSPALRLLRGKYPDAQIDLLCMFKGVVDIYQRNPDINSILYWDFLEKSLLSSLKFVFGLRGKYDISISVYPQNRWEYNTISFLAGGKYRLAHEYICLNFRSLYFLNNCRINEDDARHNVEENIQLVGLLDVNSSIELPPLYVNLTDKDKQDADDWLKGHNLNYQSMLIGIHAASAEFKNHIHRRWAWEKFSIIGNRLIKEKGATILLFGGSDEKALNDRINGAMDNQGFVVQADFMTTAALMHRCKMLVCNDTGLMHVAAALQIPIVTIFAYTNPAYVYPWKTNYLMVRHALECSPCFYYSPRPVRCKLKNDRYKCISQIDVEEVWQAVDQVLYQNEK